MLHLRNLWLALVLVVASLPTVVAAGPALPAGKTCQGTLVLGNKTYRLEHAVVYETKLYEKNVIAVLLAEGPIPVDKLKAAIVKGSGTDDDFFYSEPYSKINFSKDGKPLFSNANGAGHSLSVAGSGLAGELIVKDGRVQGNATIEMGDPPQRKQVLNARFAGPIIMLPVAIATAKMDDAKSTSRTRPATKDAERTAADTGRKPSARDLPLPADATDIEKKEIVEQLTFQSPADVKTLSGWLSKQFKAGGWKGDDDDEDLVTPNSAILKRVRAGAEVTVFVKPNGTGSKVTIMTSGLSWEEPAK